MEDVILPDLKMIDWDFNKKMAYLKQRKEFLYEAWYQKLQNATANRFEKANKDAFYQFYNTFTSLAKVLLASNYDTHMPQVILLQKETEQEIEAFLTMPKLLETRSKTHSEELRSKVSALLNDKDAFDSHLVDQLNTIRMLYIHPLTNENRYLWLRIGYKCEAMLLNKDSFYLSIEQTREFGNKYVKSFDDLILPVRNLKYMNLKAKEKVEGIPESHPKYYYMFQSLVEAHPELAKYQPDYYELSERIRLWTMIFEEKRYTYYKHFDIFQKAIATDIKLYNQTHNLPQPIISSLYKYAVNRLEKLEVFKQITGSIAAVELREKQDNHKKYLLDWGREICEQCKQQKLTTEFKNDVISMYHLQASFFTKNTEECNWFMERLYKNMDYTPPKYVLSPVLGNPLKSKHSITAKAYPKI